jgi:hypothetical protein
LLAVISARNVIQASKLACKKAAASYRTPKLEVLMDSKERLMTALHKGKPDRLPISVHQWQAYHLKYFLNGISALEAFQKFGMDAQIQYFGDVGQSALVDYDFTMKLPRSATTPTTGWPIMRFKPRRGC